MPAGWLEDHFNTIQTPNTFENRYAINYNLRIVTITLHFKPKIGRKIRIFSFGQKNNILVKKKECN